MSVQINTYVILGIKLEIGVSDSYERYEPFMDSAFKPRQAGFIVLYDAMNWNYIIIGHVLAVTDEMGVFHEVSCLDAPKNSLMESIKDEILSHFGIEAEKLNYIVVSHHR